MKSTSNIKTATKLAVCSHTSPPVLEGRFQPFLQTLTNIYISPSGSAWSGVIVTSK